MPGAFYRASQGALMTRAGAGLPSRADSAVFGYETAQHIDIFVIDVDGFICAKLANLGPRYKSAWTGKAFAFI